jgi:hypothetical protein
METALKVESGVYTPDDLENMNYEELTGVMEECEDAVRLISDQLAKAKAEKVATGKYADPDWYASAKAAMKIFERFRTRIARLRKKKKKAARPLSYFFMEAAEDMLPEGQFRALKEIAQEKQDGVKG